MLRIKGRLASTAKQRTLLKVVLKVIVTLTTLSGHSMFAQITKLTDKATFSEDAVSLGFGELVLAAGAEESDIYSVFGVRFVGEGGSVPTVRTVTVFTGVPPTIDTIIRNESPTGTSADRALIVQFMHPLVRAGFDLVGNGFEDTIASVQAFTAKGQLLGTVEQNEINETRGPFVGVETSHPEGISTVVLDYGEEEAPEQINSLIIDYLEPRSFKKYLPQIAHGRAGDFLLQTTLQIQNLYASSQVEVWVKLLLFDQAGDPLTLNLNGEENSSFEFTLSYLRLKQLTTEGPADKVAVGYACIESNYPELCRRSTELPVARR